MLRIYSYIILPSRRGRQTTQVQATAINVKSPRNQVWPFTQTDSSCVDYRLATPTVTEPAVNPIFSRRKWKTLTRILSERNPLCFYCGNKEGMHQFGLGRKTVKENTPQEEDFLVTTCISVWCIWRRLFLIEMVVLFKCDLRNTQPFSWELLRSNVTLFRL